MLMDAPKEAVVAVIWKSDELIVPWNIAPKGCVIRFLAMWTL